MGWAVMVVRTGKQIPQNYKTVSFPVLFSMPLFCFFFTHEPLLVPELMGGVLLPLDH